MKLLADCSCRCQSEKIMEETTEFEHPFHEHPLILIDQKFEDVEDEPICSGCTAPIISGPHFSCSQCSKFILHKSCAVFPKENFHFVHHQHPLVLLNNSTYESGGSVCYRCDDSIKGFIYHCSICKYEIDILCASLQRNYFNCRDHKHKFLMLKPTSFTCDLCGKQSKGKSYLCTTCQVQVHQSCASAPHSVKLCRHDHCLKLTFAAQIEEPFDSIRQFCKICRNEVDMKYGFYYCADCSYIADLQCGRSEVYLEDESEADKFKSVRDEVFDLDSLHQHKLIMSKDEPENPLMCNACVSLISAPFYRCYNYCSFFLHESCSKLPKWIHHSLDPHVMRLIPDSTRDKDTFCCRACVLECNGFSYFCEVSNIHFDIKCALRPDEVFIEEAHSHPIRLVTEDYERKCNGLGFTCRPIRYRCADCDYNLDVQCVGLPTSAKHKRDKHPLQLTYKSTEDDLGGYYCDECEERRDPNNWFYFCKICDRSVHPWCMELHNLNLMKTYRMEEHPHPLSIAINRKVSPSCSKCGSRFHSYFLQCAGCKFYIHMKGDCVDI